MKQRLADLILPQEALEWRGPQEQEISGIATDSRELVSGGLFIAMPGLTVDGHDFIPTALEKGASAIVAERLPDDLPAELSGIRVASSQHMAGYLAHRFFEEPSQSLRVVGVTGTNGKTTVASLLYRLFQSLGYRCGLISTIEVWIGDQRQATGHTTPDPVRLQSHLRSMVEAECAFCFMEVSSHALAQQRVNGLHFTGGIFTNISHDHLDYHGTFNNYIQAKKKLFDQLPEEAFALVNFDDKRGPVMLQNCRAHTYRMGLRQEADYQTRILEAGSFGMRLLTRGCEWFTPMLGRFNAYNLTAVYGAAHLLGAEEEVFLPALSRLGAVRGRMERVADGHPFHAIVDYAHTPDALENVLKTLRETFRGPAQVITVVGCGGNRDRAKRPMMAQTALQYSDRAIFTSDNPRNESPERILEDMMSGVGGKDKYRALNIVDRQAAIRTACSLARPEDVVLVAGKGHETYQEVSGERRPFDDRAVILEYVKESSLH
jgi:UDP-N-acetylmuramoyl-L-alanyl-D-glutamate--2,6-diaminopimelate ligase